MMSLVETLINRGMLGEDTVVTLGNRSRKEPSDYIVLSIASSSAGYHLGLREVDGTNTTAAMHADIVAIDGMAIDRYADVYNINSDGSVKSVGKKRGRKPKLR